MAKIKFTKNELRMQQHKLVQLEKYLPTLQLKKAMLQSVIGAVDAQVKKEMIALKASKDKLLSYKELFSSPNIDELFDLLHIEKVEKEGENIAGVEVFNFKRVEFFEGSYSFFDTPIWYDTAMSQAKLCLQLREEVAILIEKKQILEKELREVTIRVNLFEKRLIPQAKKNIKKIRVFLGDQQLSAVAQAKVAKTKILAALAQEGAQI